MSMRGRLEAETIEFCVSFVAGSSFPRDSVRRFGEEHLSTGTGAKGHGVHDMLHARTEARSLFRLHPVTR